MDPRAGSLHPHGTDPSDTPEGVGRPEGAALLPVAHDICRQSRAEPGNGGQVLGRRLVEVHRAAQEDEFKPREGTRAPWIAAAGDPVLRRYPASFRLASAWCAGRETPQRRGRHAGEEKGRKGEAPDHAFGPSKTHANAPRGWESRPKHASFHGPER